MKKLNDTVARTRNNRRARRLVAALAFAATAFAANGAMAADPAHVAEFEKGPVSFNAWRSANPEVKVDLSGADFGGQTNLFYLANLKGANLNGADVSGVELRKTRLRDATLIGANLNGSTFREASLTNADLTGANLAGAAMRTNTNMTGVTLNRADLSGATVLGSPVLTGATVDADTVLPTGFVPADRGVVVQQGSCMMAGQITKTYEFAIDGTISGRQYNNTIELTERLDLALGFVYEGRYIGSTAGNPSTFVVSSCVQSAGALPQVTIDQTHGSYTSRIVADKDGDAFAGTWSDIRGNRGDVVMRR